MDRQIGKQKYGLVERNMEGLDDMIRILAYMVGYRRIQMDGLMDELMYRQTSYECRVISQGLSRRNVEFTTQLKKWPKAKTCGATSPLPHTYSKRRDLNFPVLRSNTAFTKCVQQCKRPRKRGQPVACPDTVVFRHWGVRTLACPDTDVFRHWCVRTLVCSGSSVFRHWRVGTLVASDTDVFRHLCSDTGVSRRWCVQTLLCSDTGVSGHWCVQTLVCADNGVSGHSKNMKYLWAWQRSNKRIVT
jgi:hypothetical protein